MTFQDRIREIQSAFVMEFQDRETCLSLFESLLHEHGLLPVEEQLDRTITNENFLALLKMAREHRDVQDPGLHVDEQDALKRTDENLRKADENFRKLTQWMKREMMQGADRRYRIADSVKQYCPVCQKPTNALFNRVQKHLPQNPDQQTSPVDPPRCQDCMLKWVEERFGMPVNEPIYAKPEPPVTVDGSLASPMSPSEADFFVEYEKQMEKL